MFVSRSVPYIRNILWAEGVLFCLSVPQIAAHLIENSASYVAHEVLLSFIYVCLGYVFFVGLTALAAAYGLEQNRRWSPKALRISAVANLPVVPVGSLIGAWCLWLTINRQARAQLIDEVILLGGGGQASRKRIPSRHSSWPERFALIAQFTAGLLLIPVMAERMKAQGSPALGYWSFIAAFVGAVLGGILCHELGHVLAGSLAGFRFQALSAGPLVASRLSDNWQIQWVNSMGLWNGMTIMSPSGPNGLRARAVIFVVGGPLGSILCGAVSLGLMVASPQLHWSGAAEFFGILGVIELVNGTANLIPFRVPGGFTDGARLVQLIGKRPEGQRFLAELAFGLSDTTTLRPKDWHPAWIQAVTEDETSPGFSLGCYHAYVYHLDRGEIDDASVWLARCMDSHRALRRDPYRSILAIENAFFEARHMKNLDAAKEWLSVPRVGIPAERFTILRVRAAIHIAEGERELAGETIKTALRLHAMTPATGRQQFERTVLRDVENWLDELTGAGSLSRLAQAVRERDTLIAASKALEPPQSPIQRLLRPPS